MPAPSPRPRAGSRRWLFRIVFLVVGTVVGALVAEGAYRIWIRSHPPPFQSFLTYPRDWDEYQLYELMEGPQKLDLIPNGRTPSLQTNALALRDREYAGVKPAGVHRIVALGDSVTFGVQVDQELTWENQLEGLLVGRTDRPVEVLNLGVPGYNAEQSLLRFQRRGLALDPDLVVYQWGYNDLSFSPVVMATNDTVVYLYWGDGHYEPGGYRIWPRVNTWLLANSVLYRGISLSLFVWVDNLLRPEQQFRDTREHNKQAMLGMRDAAEESGAEFLVVLFPELSTLQEPADREDREEVEAFLRENDVAVYDLWPVFQGQDPAYLRLAEGDDIHMNATGYRVVAESLAQELEARAMVPMQSVSSGDGSMGDEPTGEPGDPVVPDPAGAVPESQATPPE